MLTHEQKTAILNLLTESRQALSSDRLTSTHRARNLKRAVGLLELREEIEALSAMVDTDNFEEAFRERCRLRAIANTNTPLSFFSSPDGVCNNLYWNILLQLIPAPNSMGKMLAILAPNVGQILSPDLGFQRNEGRVEYNVTLVEKPVVTALTQPASQEELPKFVVLREGLLFNVDDISAYNFELHSTFYEQLSHQYADTIDNLYQHNQELKTLQNQMLQISQGQSPLDAIQRLISGLEQSETFANTAFTDFLVYLESLAPEDKRRLQALTPSGHSKSIEAVILDLRGGGCTIAANTTLSSIINNSENHAFLTSRSSTLSPEDIRSIKNRYKRNNRLSSAHDDTKKLAMPESLIVKFISDITISTQWDCAIILQYFPPSHYEELLRHTRIDTYISGFLSPLPLFRRSGIMLNEQQQAALERAIFTNYSKFGNLVEILKFAIEQNYNYLAEHILSLSDAQGNTALHLLGHGAENPTVWAASMAKLQENARLAALQKKNNAGDSVLDLIIGRPNLVNATLTSLPENMLLAVLTERRGRYSSLVSSIDLSALPTTLSVEARHKIHEDKQLDTYWFRIHLATDLSACFGAAALVVGIILLDTVLAPILAGLGAGLLIGATGLACYSFFSSKSPGNPVVATSNNRVADQPTALEMAVAL